MLYLREAPSNRRKVLGNAACDEDRLCRACAQALYCKVAAGDQYYVVLSAELDAAQVQHQAPLKPVPILLGGPLEASVRANTSRGFLGASGL